MNFRSATNKAQKILGDNSPQILTALAVAGTITTAYFAGTASFKAAEILADEEMSREVKRQAPHMTDVAPMTKREKFDLVWKLYIPAVTSATTTIACIVGSNRIGMRRTAALTAAYTLSEIRYDEYRQKIVEKMGVKKEQDARDEIAQSRIMANPPREDFDGQIHPGSGKVLCHDAYSGRYFASSMELLRKAENDIAKQIWADGSASLSNFYNNVGLPQTSVSDEMGWNHEEPLVLGFSSVLTPDNKPCLSYDFQVTPVRDFWRVAG